MGRTPRWKEEEMRSALYNCPGETLGEGEDTEKFGPRASDYRTWSRGKDVPSASAIRNYVQEALGKSSKDWADVLSYFGLPPEKQVTVERAVAQLRMVGRLLALRAGSVTPDEVICPMQTEYQQVLADPQHPKIWVSDSWVRDHLGEPGRHWATACAAAGLDTSRLRTPRDMRRVTPTRNGVSLRSAHTLSTSPTSAAGLFPFPSGIDPAEGLAILGSTSERRRLLGRLEEICVRREELERELAELTSEETALLADLGALERARPAEESGATAD